MGAPSAILNVELISRHRTVACVSNGSKAVVRLIRMFAKRQTFVACDKLMSRTNEPKGSYAARASRLRMPRALLPKEGQSMSFRVLVVGGSGQVGSGLVRALLASSSCTDVVMVNRRTIPLAADTRLRQVIMDTGAASFASKIADLARSCSAQGEPLYAASCIGIGKGSQRWSEEDIKKLEIGLIGAFARGCLAAGIERFGLLSAAGSSAKSRIRYARIMGEKEDAVRSLGFKRLAIFRPGIIAGNAHTPGVLALLGRLVPGSFGTIDQDDIGRAFVGEFLHGQDGTTILDNAAMKRRSRAH
jgi:hypothetical protein